MANPTFYRRNALGQVKFIFPNKFNVYLHDTPSRLLTGPIDQQIYEYQIKIIKEEQEEQEEQDSLQTDHLNAT